MNGIASQCRMFGPKVGCFAGFCHHSLMTMNAQMLLYCYPLLENATKTGFRMMASCRKDKVLLSKHK